MVNDGGPTQSIMRLHVCSSRRYISVIVVLVVVQVSVTCIWLAISGNGDTVSIEEEADQSKLKRQHVVINSLVPTTRKHSTKTSPRNRTPSLPRLKKEDGRSEKEGSDSIGEESHKTNLSNERPTKVHTKDDKVVRKVQVPQSKWLLRLFSAATSHCNGNLEFYEKLTALLRNVIVDPSKAHTQAKGGVKIQDVLMQKESAEFYRLEKGLITVENCSNKPDLHKFIFGHSTQDVAPLSDAVMLSKDHYRTEGEEIDEYDGNFVIVLTRFEYANVYWTVIDLFNTFLMMQLYNRTFSDTDLWILDAHPDSSLDALYTGTFRRVFRLTEFTRKVRFKNLLPCFARGKTPILIKVLRPLALASKFRNDVLSALHVPLQSEKDREMRCKENNLNVLFVWRRNYVGHPRNPKGIVTRKISNENALLSASRSHFPNYTIRGEQLDKLPISEQMELIGNTDIMVGMHGAAFGFTVFMKEGSGVLELWPRSTQGNWHMEYLAKRCGMYYQSWENNDPRKENIQEKSTVVSPEAVNSKINSLSVSICSKYSTDPVR